MTKKKRYLKTTINGKTVYCAVYCKDCIHHDECNAKRKEMGIVTFVEGLVDCEGYRANRENHT